MELDAEEVRARLAEVIAAMKAHGVWDVVRPVDATFTEMGAFGSRTMAFSQWLRFVFVPSIEERLAAGGPWPASSSVGAQATREGDTDPQLAALVPALTRFDEVFAPKPERARVAYEAGRAAHAAGDDTTALTELRRALALDPACDNAENFAAWILLKKAVRTPMDVEEAIAHLRRAPAGIASANLADALVAAERADEAVAAMRALPECAEARNWLGWRLLASDPAAAASELREAVRLRATWGVAWQNLAKALDALGDAGAACHAYGEAVACGDAYDDALARDRRVQLELALRTRGEAPPEPPPAALADSEAARIVIAAAARPALATGTVFLLRPTTRVADGALPFAGVATVVAGRALYHLIVRDDGGTRVAFVQTHEDPIALRWTAADDPARAAGWLAEWVAAGGADVYALTPLDTAVFVLDTVRREVPRRWRLAITAARPAALAIEDVDADVAVAVRARAGAAVELELAAGERVEATSPAQLVPHMAAIVASVRRAVAAGKQRDPRARGDRLAVPGRVFAEAIAAALAGGVRELAIEGDRAPAYAVVADGCPLVLVLDYNIVHAWVPPKTFYVGIGDDATAALAEVVAAARARAAAPTLAPNLIELAVGAADRLATALGETWTLAIPGTPGPSEVWLRGAEPAADAVGVFAGRLRVDGVAELAIHRRSDLDACAAELVAHVREQRARFARHVALADRMRALAEQLALELGGRLGTRYALAWPPVAPNPRATVTEVGNPRAIAVVLSNDRERDGDEIRVHAGAPGAAGWTGHVRHLEPAIEFIAAAVQRRRDTLTGDTLRGGARYRVLRGIDGLMRGAIVRFDHFEDVDNHYGRLLFVDEATGREVVVEGDFSIGDHAPLADAYNYLEAL